MSVTFHRLLLSPILSVILTFISTIFPTPTLGSDLAHTEADSLVKAADFLAKQEQFSAALTNYQRAVSLFQQAADSEGVAQTAILMGDVYCDNLGKSNEAKDYYENALRIYQRLGNQQEECKLLSYLCWVYNDLRDFDAALEALTSCLDLSRELKDPIMKATALLYLGNAYVNTAQLEKAMDAYNQSLRILRQKGRQHGVGVVLFKLGRLYAIQSKHQQAADCFKESAGVYGAGGDSAHEAGALYGLAIELVKLADYQGALQSARRSLQLHTAIKDSSDKSNDLYLLGNICFHMSDYPGALQYYRQSMGLCREISEPEGEAKCLSSIGLIYYRLNDNSKSLDYFEQSLALRRKIGDRKGEGSALGHLGTIHENLGDYRTALEYCQRALELNRELGDHTGEFNSLCALGNIYQQLGQDDLALTQFQRALEVSRELADPRREAWVDYSIGNLHYSRKRYNLAVDYVQRALNTVADLDVFGDLETQYSILLGDCHAAKGLDSLAVEDYTAAINLADSVRGGLEVEAQRRSYVERLTGVYAHMVLSLLRLDRGDAAFEYVERSRARAFLDLLASGNLDIAAGWQKGAAGKQNYEPELALLATVQPLSLSEVQILLDDDSELLEYYITDDRLLIWLISKNSVEVFTVEVSAGQLEEMTLGFRTTIELRGDIRPLSRDLYRLLVTPVEQAITSDKLIIVPHSILNYLPFQALQNETGDYLIDRYSITYLPSASVMKFLPSKRRQFKGKLLALGNPATDREGFKSLPFAEGEVTGIGNIFPGSAVRIGADATEEEFRRLAGQYDLLHLSCHSELNAAYPMFSGLLLSPGGDQDGELDVHEVFTLDLNAYLVVLSGCETGLGKLTSGDDLVGLSRAFIYAGTPALAASLWQVADESTGYLMTEFYRNLRECGRAEALRQAQLATREKYPHPFHWAPFVLIGEGQ